MTKKKLIIIIMLVGIILIAFEFIRSSKKNRVFEIDHIITDQIHLSNDEIKYLRRNKITLSQINPYLKYEIFNVYNFFFYEDIRTRHKVSHLEALNSFHHPEFFSHHGEIKTAIFTNSPLILVNKQFFVSEKYLPDNLVNINQANVPYIKRDNEEMFVNQEALNYYQELYKESKHQGFELVVFSGYRDWHKQKVLYYFAFEENNQISAKPGHSEHQTGLAFDISTLEFGLTNFFESSNEYQWLKHNAHRFGFIIRFPEHKEYITGYRFEPWHFRYVGVDNAMKIYENNLTLEEYLFKFFEIK